MERKLNKAFQLIKDGKNFIALTGAGISTAAGIPDFRSKNGIYTTGKYSQNIFDLGNFKKDPLPFWNFARDFIKFLKNAQPTKMHKFLSDLENEMGKKVTIVTQNIDNLHREARSKNIIELHGTMQTSHCLKCDREYKFQEVLELLKRKKIPNCSCGGQIKPDIVFFSEPVNGLEEAFQIVLKADTMLIIGTSLSVYPASILPNYFKGNIIIINKGQLANFVLADVFLDMNIEEVAEYFSRKKNIVS